jgi:hypothetical protein
MKIQSIVLGLMLSTAALADGVSVHHSGKVANIMGSLKGTSSEVFDFVSRAYENGFKDAQGADFFNKTTFKEGTRSHTTYKNKNVTVTLDSAFAVIYKLELKGKAGDIKLDATEKVLTVKGEAAKILMGALLTTIGIERGGPLGVGRVQTKSGKVTCSKVVAPRAVPSCTLIL